MKRIHGPIAITPTIINIVQAGAQIADSVRCYFTINAMTFDLVADELIDHHHGLEDRASSHLRFLHGVQHRTTPLFD